MKRSRTAEEEAEDIATKADVKKELRDAHMTRPPFKTGKAAPLNARKTKGKWADPKGTFGI